MFKLRPYQEPIADKVFTFLRNNKDKHPLIAVPTGGGKTVILAEVISQAINKWPNTKILVLSHVREILEQDYESIKFHTKLDVGMYSAGLDKREKHQVTVAGIQSVHRIANEFADYNLIIIDEAHLIPPGDDSMYRRFFKGIKNPRYFGLTATPFRLGAGYIYGQEDSIFTDLIYDLTSRKKFNQLISDGFLCNLKVQATDLELDTNNIKTVAGDFDNKQLSQTFDIKSITKRAVKEIIKSGKSYKKWLIFAIDIEHAENIAEELTANGIITMVIHSKMEFDRATVIRHYKSGTFRCIVNVNVLTTGFDDPSIDLIALLRPTKSPVIHVQTIGRGLRIAEGKDHCLIMDFAGNTQRLGPINDIVPHKKGKGQKGGEPPAKVCPECKAIHHPITKICEFCGHVFKFKTALESKSGKHDVLASSEPYWTKVDAVVYALHKKANTPDMVRVTYNCGLLKYVEYVCIEHKGYAKHRAQYWLQFRGASPTDTTTAKDVVRESGSIKNPGRIRVDKSKKYPAIIDYSF